MEKTARVHDLTVKERQADPDTVQLLEEVLARAKSGETRGVLVLEQSTHTTSYSTTGLKDRYSLIGYLQCAMHNLLGK